MSLKLSANEYEQCSHRSPSIRNYDKLIGPFQDAREFKMYSLIEKRFDPKRSYSERDWLTQNREEVPQSFPLYERTQIVAKMEHPRVQKVLLLQMWTDQAFFRHPFYTGLVKQMQKQIETFLPGVVCELYNDPP